MRERLPPDSELPTVGESRAQGLVALTVHCLGGRCGRKKRFLFVELALPDEMIFLHIGRHRRFVCDGCGSRNVEIIPDWTGVRAHGNGSR